MLIPKDKQHGFTIIELLVVIIIIAILATLVVIAYNGIQSRARTAIVQSDLSSAARALEAYRYSHGSDESYPSGVDCSTTPATNTICLSGSQGTTYQYTYNAQDNSYILTATNDTIAYHITSTNKSPAVGVGDGHTAPGEEDAPVDGWWKIAGGDSFACGIYNGHAYCWGTNGTQGRFGNGTTTDSLTPTAVSTAGVLAGKTLVDIAVGSAHACVLTSEAQMYCWGYNSVGQLGNNHVGDTGGGSFPYARLPVAVDTSGVLAGKVITAITAQQTTTCVVASGANYCWGENGWSQRGVTGADIAVPAAVSTSGALGGKTFGTILGSGYNHSCSVDSAGLVYCWGYNYYGQVGNNTTGTTSTPSAVVSSGVLSGKTVTAVSGGEIHTCVIASGLGYCWGRELNGRLGNGAAANVSRSSPVAVSTSGVLSGKTLSAITSTTSSSCAVASGAVYCWGQNSYGEAGTGATGETSSPVAVTTSGVMNGKVIQSLSSGVNFICAIDTSGDAYCWGRNNYGQLGSGATSTYSTTPVQVTDPS